MCSKPLYNELASWKWRSTSIVCAQHSVMTQLVDQTFILKLFNLEEHQIQDFFIRYHQESLCMDVRLTIQEETCPVCGTQDKKIKDYRLKKINHSVLNHTPCIIYYQARRYQCKACQKTFYEPNPFALPGMRQSLLTVYNVLSDLRSVNETFSSVATRHHLSTNTVINIFDQHVQLSRKELTPIICMDEVYAFNSDTSKYACVFLDYESQEILDILPSRHKRYLSSYLFSIEREELDQVKAVCIDMWETYRSIIKIYFKNAICVVDRFHILQEFNRALHRVRIDVMNTLDKNDKQPLDLTRFKLNQAQIYYVFKKFSWILSKNRKYKDHQKYFDINTPKRFNRVLNRYCNYLDFLDIMLTYSTDLKQAYDFKVSLDRFFDTHKSEANKIIDSLILSFKQSDIQVMTKFGNTLVNWKQEILNSFIILPQTNKTLSNAIIENRNKVIKTIKRNSNGYTNWSRFRNRVLYVVNDTPLVLRPNNKKGN